MAGHAPRQPEEDVGPILVLASAGFIGQAVCERAPSAIGFSRQHGLDLLDPLGLARLIGEVRPSAVINCSGMPGKAPAHQQYAVHVQGTLNLLQAVRDHAPGAAVVILGSAAEYGSPGLYPTPEEAPARPRSIYGASKLAQTHLAAAAAAEWGLRLVVARLFNVIGPGLPPQYFLASLASRLRTGAGPVAVDGFPCTRDFVDVRDVACALALLTRAATPGESLVVNVGSGSEASVGEVAAYLGSLAGREVVDSGKPGGLARSVADVRKLRELTGWEPAFPWRESVRAYWASLMASPGREGEPT
jgi:nucleoside-diphosphate-sugar epimerase